MRKSGTVISILKDKKSGVQKFGLILDNSETEEACSINTDGNQVKDCASCSGCGFSKQKKGVFVVTGNMVTAVNKSGKNIHIGDSVQLEIQESKAKLQAVFSVFVPALFAAAAAYIFYSFFNNSANIFFALIILTFVFATEIFRVSAISFMLFSSKNLSSSILR